MPVFRLDLYEKHIAPLPWHQRAWYWCNMFFLFVLLGTLALAKYICDEVCEPPKKSPPDPKPGPPPSPEELIAKAKADLQRWAKWHNKI